MERKRRRSSSESRENDRTSSVSKKSRSNSTPRCSYSTRGKTSNKHYSSEADDEGSIFRKRRTTKFLHASNCLGTDKDIEEMAWHLRQCPALIDKVRGNGANALITAVIRGHEKCVKFLLESGINFNALDMNGNNALCLAVTKYSSIIQGNEKCSLDRMFNIVKLILDHGCSPNWEKISILPPARVPIFTYVITSNLVKLVELFLQYGVDLSNQCVSLDDDTNRHSHLYYAIREGNEKYNPDIIKLLLEYGSKPDFNDEDDIAVILIQCRRESLKLILLYHAAPIVHGPESSLYDVSYGFWTFNGEESMDNKLKMLNILYKFGCNLWMNEGEFPLDLEEEKQFYEEMNKIRCTPLSLKCLSRISILHQMGPCKYVKNIQYLDIPSTLKDFMYFPDV